MVDVKKHMPETQRSSVMSRDDEMILRKYEAAQVTRLNNWIVAQESAETALRDGQLTRLRDLAREACQNNNYAKRYLQLLSNNVLGATGIALEMDVRDMRNGVDQGPDDLANQIIEKKWKEFCKQPTADGTITMLDLQNIVLTSVARDGELLCRDLYNLPSGQLYALSLHEGDYLDDRYNIIQTTRGTSIHMSVETDIYGRPVVYHMYSGHPADRNHMPRLPIPANEITHIKSPERAMGHRGVSWMASALIPLRQLKEYIKSETINARIKASAMGFFVQKPDAEGGFTGNRQDANGDPVMDLEAGTFQNLPPGVELQTFSPPNSVSNFEIFVKTRLHEIAVGLGISYNSLVSDLENVNYSSMRAGVQEDRQYYQKLQDWMVDHFLQPVFEKWLRHNLALRQLTFPGGKALPIDKFEKFNNPSWTKRRWGWIDPSKDVDAAIALIGARLRAPNDFTKDAFGKTYRETLQQFKADMEAEEEFGVSAFDLGSKNPIDKVADPIDKSLED